MRKFSDFLKDNTFTDVPPWDFYKDLCQEFGENFMSFPEFESRFISFHKGEKRDYDQRSETPMKSFSDLPVEIIGMFVKRLRLIDRIFLRQVSPNLQWIVETQSRELISNFVWFQMRQDDCSIDIGRVNITYKRLDGGYQITDFRNGVTKTFKDSDYLEGVLNGFMTIFGNLKSKIKFLKVNICSGIDDWLILIEKVFKLFENSRKLHVKILDFSANEIKEKPNPEAFLLPLLSVLKPGKLRNITSSEMSGGWQKIAETEQWKQARSFETSTKWGTGSLNSAQLEQFAHFNHFDVALCSFEMTELADFIKKLSNWKNFARCRIRVNYGFTAGDYAIANNKKLYGRKEVRVPMEEGSSHQYIRIRFEPASRHIGMHIEMKKRIKRTKN